MDYGILFDRYLHKDNKNQLFSAIMKRFEKILLVLICFTIASNLYSAKPVIEVGTLLPEEQLEYYEDSDELFAMKVMEYYQAALTLSVQLEMMGQMPEVVVTPPSIEQLEDLEVDIIIEYFIVAKRLENQVKQAPETDYAALQEIISNLRTSMNDTIAHYIRVNRDLNSDIHNERIAMLKECDSLLKFRMQELENEFFAGCINSTPLISASALANYIFLSGSDALQSDISLGVNLNINLGKILGAWNGLGIWYEYVKPNFTTERLIEEEVFNEMWDTDLHAVGGSILFHIHKNPKYTDGIQFTAGYFWIESDIYNDRRGTFFNMSGLKLSAEYFASIPSCRFPFDIFIRFDLYNSFEDDIFFETALPDLEPIPVDRTLPGISIGLRYNFFRSFDN